MMTPRLAQIQYQTRRHFLASGSLGLGAAALAVLSRDGQAEPGRSPDPLAPKKPHFATKAKRVIYLHMSGSPPHLDLFDYKPELVKRSGQDCPESTIKGKRFALPESKVMVHQPWGQIGGQASDVEIQMNEVIKEKQLLNEILAKHTGQPMERIEQETERDRYFSAQQAMEFGLVDEILVRK